MSFLEYALQSVLGNKGRNSIITVLFASLVFVIFSMLSIGSALQHELSLSHAVLPDLTIQNMSGGRQVDIPVDLAYDFSDIPGVTHSQARVWGYYYFEPADVQFTMIGIDPDLPQYAAWFNKQLAHNAAHLDSVGQYFFIPGPGVKRIMKSFYYEDSFNFIDARGHMLELRMLEPLAPDSEFLSSDIVLVHEAIIRDLFNYSLHEATDIVLTIPNPLEVDNIMRKIRMDQPQLKLTSKAQLVDASLNYFNYGTGIFLIVFLAAFVAFFIMVFDKASGLSLEETHEIAVLRSLGWKIKEIIYVKLLSHAYLSMAALLLGTATSLFYVFYLNAPGMLRIFTGPTRLDVNFRLIPLFDLEAFLMLSVLVLPVYLTAVLVPTWRSATRDPHEVLR